MRFGLMSFPGDGRDVEADAQLAAAAGFEILATGDHLRHPRDPTVPLLDGWSVLAAWAANTQPVHLAMLVSNIIYRHPTLVAKQAIAVDQLSGGRLDVGVGAGVYLADHEMAGVSAWSPGYRVDRLSEFVRALDMAMRGAESFDGQFYRFSDASWSPGPVQDPRPPILIGAVGARVLRLTAELTDGWSAFGGFGIVDEDAYFAALQAQTETLDRCCEQVGRDPRSVRRSLLAFRPLVPWQSLGALEHVALTARRLGFDEVIFFKPAGADEMRVFEDAAPILLALKEL